MKHVSHVVRLGTFKLKTSDGKDHLAFVNPDETIVWVLVNTAQTDKKYTVAVSGKSFEILLKAKSFNTLTWK
jgi:glucosylceramidase